MSAYKPKNEVKLLSRKFRFLALVFAFAPVRAPAAANVSLPADAVAWRALAARDLRAIHDTLAANSPFMVVKRDSAAPRKWLEEGYVEATKRLPQVTDAASTKAVLSAYAGGFRDSHIRLFTTHDFPSPGLQWPEFATAWRGHDYVVSDAGTSTSLSLPRNGARLIGCDGETAEQIARRRLDLFEGNLRLYGRIESAPLLLWNDDNPFAEPQPKICSFFENGRRQRYVLTYSRASDANIEAAHRVIELAHAPLGVERWDQGYWIGVPRLYGEGWDAFFANVKALLPQLRRAPNVVIDVRGDGGGDSAYAYQLANLLWGKRLVAAYAPDLGPVVYRASQTNRETYANYAAAAAKTGHDQQLAALQSILTKFDHALASHSATFTVPGSDDRRCCGKRVHNPMRGRVIVLTDPICTSACLDLADLFLAIPNVMQAGTETNADTIFMDITNVKLPSSLFSINFGHKAWIRRPRGSNVTYRPAAQWTFPGDLADDGAWRAWLTAKVRSDRSMGRSTMVQH